MIEVNIAYIAYITNIAYISYSQLKFHKEMNIELANEFPC